MDREQLVPVVVLVIPRFTKAVPPVAAVLDGFGEPRFAVGYYRDVEERRDFYAGWPNTSATPLLLLRGSPEAPSAFEVVAEIAARHARHPLAVLIADGPELEGYKAEGSELFCRELGNKLEEAHADVQVFLYSATWSNRPPRIR